MEPGQAHRIGSLGSSLSRSENIFSLSSFQVEEDEEALKWVALEKLPTYSRIKKTVQPGPDGRFVEVDVQNIKGQERKKLLERLVPAAGDNAVFMQKFKNRLDRVGIDLPTVEVRFEHIKVEAETYISVRALPTIYNMFVNLLEAVASSLHIIPRQKKSIPILRDISGIIKPKRMTLLLGPPGSGKTTLLLALAGRLSLDLKVSGKVSYNGHELKEFVPQKTAAYISQYDLHIGEMTVRETLAFSARCQGSVYQREMLLEILRREKAAGIKPDPDMDAFMKAASMDGQDVSVVTDYILKILGLEVCADTMVGNEMLRGVSRGQRRRVTIGEILVGPARALFIDEISTGLDSSTIFQIVNSLGQYINILGGTAVTSLLQPAPETYDLFDDIILLSDGHIAYQGPREHALEFFDSMGFKCPERKGIADFLQEVTSRKDQQQYWVRQDEPYRFVSAEEFTEAFLFFHAGQKLKDELAVPFDKSTSHPDALVTSIYGVGKLELLKACIARELLLMDRNLIIYVSSITQIVLLAFITMTVFLRSKMHHDSEDDGRLFRGALFTSITFLLLNGYSEFAMTASKLPIFYKQRDLRFYPAWSYALTTSILKIPIAMVEVALWVFMTYYVIGFDPNVGRLFKQYLLLLLLNQVTSAMFRFFAASMRNTTLAIRILALLLMAFLILSDHVIPKGDTKKWWIWAYWCSPVMYVYSGLSTNEFLGKSWNHVLANTTESLGIRTMRSRGMWPSLKWYWICVGALIGYVLLFNGLYILCLKYLSSPEKAQAVSSEAKLEERQTDSQETHIEPPTISIQKEVTISERILNESETETESIGSTVLGNQNRKATALSFRPLLLVFDDIKYSIEMPKEMRAQGIQDERLVLLKGVSGAFRPGVLTALMGVSGAGKTTLMDVLAGRKTGGYIEGTITVSGYPKKQETFSRVSGYCEKNDIHSPNVTVYESLLFSMSLRLAPEVDSATRKMFVGDVMELMELEKLKDAMVGLPGVNGLSIEQRKRLTIAVELVANPSIIFMDEPTSGFDARAASIVMRTVRNTVNTGRTVVCTIHQPSIDIFEAFDELFLMKQGGEEIYVGPLGHRSCHLINYFEGIEGVSKIKDGYNPSTWMLEVSTLAQEMTLGINFSDIYKRSQLFQRNKDLIREFSSPLQGSSDLYFPTPYSRSFATQLRACLRKQFTSYWRNRQYSAGQLIYMIVNALVVGSMFWDLGSKKSKKQNMLIAMGTMYISVVFVGGLSSRSAQPAVAIERTVFYKERASRMYSALPYALAQIIIQLPFRFFESAIYVLIFYPMSGYEWTPSKFFWFLFFMYFTVLYFTFSGMMWMAISPNQQISTVFSLFFYKVWYLFSGFTVPRPRVPLWWRWYCWACPTSWTLYGLVSSQYGDVHEKLNTGETVAEFLDNYFGFKHDWMGIVSAAMIGFCLLFAFVFVASTKVLNFEWR